VRSTALQISPLSRFWLGRSLALPFFSSLVPRPTTRFKSVSTKTKPAEAGWKTGGRISWCAENFRQCGSAALQKTTRHSLLAAVL